MEKSTKTMNHFLVHILHAQMKVLAVNAVANNWHLFARRDFENAFTARTTKIHRNMCATWLKNHCRTEENAMKNLKWVHASLILSRTHTHTHERFRSAARRFLFYFSFCIFCLSFSIFHVFSMHSTRNKRKARENVISFIFSSRFDLIEHIHVCAFHGISHLRLYCGWK